MKNLWQNKAFRVFAWQVFNAAIALAVAFVSGLEGTEKARLVGILLPVLNYITKAINLRYFSDLGVTK